MSLPRFLLSFFSVAALHLFPVALHVCLIKSGLFQEHFAGEPCSQLFSPEVKRNCLPWPELFTTMGPHIYLFIQLFILFHRDFTEYHRKHIECSWSIGSMVDQLGDKLDLVWRWHLSNPHFIWTSCCFICNCPKIVQNLTIFYATFLYSLIIELLSPKWELHFIFSNEAIFPDLLGSKIEQNTVYQVKISPSFSTIDCTWNILASVW